MKGISLSFNESTSHYNNVDVHSKPGYSITVHYTDGTTKTFSNVTEFETGIVEYFDVIISYYACHRSTSHYLWTFDAPDIQIHLGYAADTKLVGITLMNCYNTAKLIYKLKKAENVQFSSGTIQMRVSTYNPDTEQYYMETVQFTNYQQEQPFSKDGHEYCYYTAYIDLTSYRSTIPTNPVLEYTGDHSVENFWLIALDGFDPDDMEGDDSNG